PARIGCLRSGSLTLAVRMCRTLGGDGLAMPGRTIVGRSPTRASGLVVIMGTSTTSPSGSGDRPFDRSLAPSFASARVYFQHSLAGRAARTRQTYATALDRLADFLAERGVDPETPTSELPRDLLEGFYLWCVRRYGTASRSCLTYLAG